jgi:hypothetical protein
MSDITVNVTSAGAANVSVSNGSTVNASVGNGGVVNVAIGSISPGNATVVSGTLTINSVTTLAAGSSAYVKNDAGTAYAAKLDIGIPAGPATLVSVGNTTTLSSGSNATVNGTASGSNLTLAFGIPRGVNGTNGTNGTTPTITASASTLSAGCSATVTATTSNGGANVALAFGIPQGAAGSGGSSNLTLSDATPSALGTAAAGSSNLAARADHTHNLPSLSTLGAAAAAHGHNYVTSLNNLTGGLTLAAGGNVTITSANSTLTIAASGGGLGENDAVDGGNYVGEIIGGITFSVQPQSQTVSSALTVNITTLTPSGNFSFGMVGVAAFGDKLYARQWVASSGGSGTTYSGRLVSSTDNGATWTTAETYYTGSTDYPGAYTDRMSFASNGTRLLFAVGMQYGGGDNGGWRYVDGLPENGSTRLSVFGQSPDSVAYGAGRFVAVATSGMVYSSSDAVNWTQRTYLTIDPDGSVIFGVGKFFIAIGTGTNFVQSTDGVSWSSGSFVSSSFATGNSRVISVAGTTQARYTTDGSNWTQVTLPVACTRVSYAAGLFWAFSGSTGTDACTSVDGVAWTLRTMPSSQTWRYASATGNTAFIESAAFARGTVSSAAASANLTVSASASSGNPISYQWQLSVDAGTNWNAIANATSSTLNLTGLTQSDSGTRYRSAASATGAATVYSQSATLTVTG